MGKLGAARDFSQFDAISTVEGGFDAIALCGGPHALVPYFCCGRLVSFRIPQTRLCKSNLPAVVQAINSKWSRLLTRFLLRGP